MAFKPYRRLFGEGPALDHRFLMTDSEACTLGEALVLSSGALTKCGATTTPEFIAMKSIAAATTSTEYVPVIPVTPQQEWETTTYGAQTSNAAGAELTLHSDGLQCTATTSSGVFTLTYKESNDDGATVRGRFASA